MGHGVDDDIATRLVLAQVGLLPEAALVRRAEKLVGHAQRGRLRRVVKPCRCVPVPSQGLAHCDDMEALAVRVNPLEGHGWKRRVVDEVHEWLS